MVGVVMTKGKREELQTHGSLIGHRLSQFLHMSGTEMVVMTVESMMVGLTVERLMVWIAPIFLVPAMQ
jgi:hypothetical protein